MGLVGVDVWKAVATGFYTARPDEAKYSLLRIVEKS